MDEIELTRLLRLQGRTGNRRGWRCPDEARLAAYAEHRLSGTDQARLESHLADCGACLDQVEFLLGQPAGAKSPVPPQYLSRARALVGPRRAPWLTPVVRWGTMTAAAAGVILAVGLFRLQSPGEQSPPASLPAAAPAVASPVPAAPASVVPAPAAPPQALAQPAASQAAPRPAVAVRNSVEAHSAFALLSPAENATLPRQGLDLRWRAVPGAAYYEAQVVTEEGNVAWSARTDATSIRLPGDGASLEAGKKYFVWIRAYLAGGGTVKSAAVSFHIADH